MSTRDRKAGEVCRGRDIIFGHLAPASKRKRDTLRERHDASMSTLRETV